MNITEPTSFSSGAKDPAAGSGAGAGAGAGAGTTGAPAPRTFSVISFDQYWIGAALLFQAASVTASSAGRPIPASSFAALAWSTQSSAESCLTSPAIFAPSWGPSDAGTSRAAASASRIMGP